MQEALYLMSIIIYLVKEVITKWQCRLTKYKAKIKPRKSLGGCFTGQKTKWWNLLRWRNGMIKTNISEQGGGRVKE